MMKKKLASSIIALILCLPIGMIAQTGQVAVAHPLKNIKIDGDLGDWPLNIESYIIGGDNGEQWGDQADSSEDLAANFKIGFDALENVLYVAITVRDHSLVIDDSEHSDFNTHDGSEIYIDVLHSRGGSSVIMQGVYGERRVHYGQHIVAEGARYGFSHSATERIYEWKIDLPQDIEVGQSIGFDVGVFDKDQDDSFSFFAWGKETAKVTSYNRLGDVFLLDESAQYGYVYGDVVRKDSAEARLPNFVSIVSIDNRRLWTQAKVNPDGSYQIKLPVGAYQIYPTSSAELKMDETSFVALTIMANKIVQADVLSTHYRTKPPIEQKVGILKEDQTLDKEKLESFIRSYMDYYEIPGLSIAMIKDYDIQYYGGFGNKMVGVEAKVDEHTLFEAASLTKPMFSYLVNRLVDQGKIDLDKPLYQYLTFPEIEHDERYKLITARIVLSQKTGFPNWRSENPDGKINLKFTPGSQYGYSGEGFEYLKRVVCHLTESDLESLFQQEVFDVLDIENARLTWTSEQDESLTAMPHTDGRTPLPKRIWDHPFAAASLHIDAHNYAKFMIALMKGSGLTKARHEDMLKIQTRPPEGSIDSPVGLGIFVMESQDGTYYGHGGANHGFTSNAVFYTSNGMGYVFLVNNQYAAKMDEVLNTYLISGQKTK